MNEQQHHIYVCPVCGTTDLAAKVIADAVQDPEGMWSLRVPDQDDLNYLMGNPNNEVYCVNPHCGDPVDPATGEVIQLVTGESLDERWAKMNNTSLSALAPEEVEALTAWIQSLDYTPWSGTIGDCGKLE